MIEGHGDDSYRYDGIEIDFSSNICAHKNHRALMEHLTQCCEIVDHYPEPEAWSLEHMIAERHDMRPEQVIVTSGATDAIYLIAQTFRMHAVIPTPTFSEYEDACNMFQRPINTNEHSTGHRRPNQMLWLCNPNNPTGEVYDQLYVDRMMAKYDLVVLDHSYEHYTHEHIMNPRWGARTKYSVQIHSMTKTYGVPGLRLGYITGHESLMKQIRRYLRPWSVSALAIEAGKYLLQHDELICKPDLDEAQRLRSNLLNIPGINVMPTHTNFMLCSTEFCTAGELKDYLAHKHHMLIRDASNFKGLTPHLFRVAAQRPENNDSLVEAIKSIINYEL